MKPANWHHRELDVWRKSMNLASTIYSLTNQFPSAERFGLVAQMRRAAVSIPSNIAEGAARGTSLEFARFLRIARGSVAELETQLELAIQFGYAKPQETHFERLDAVRQMLTGLIRKLSK
jgi:four helix bundle protein